MLKQGAQQLEPHKNPFAWNGHANLLFIESPPGVGFSINNDPAYNQYNDSRTAQDNLLSLKLWFQKFPEFKNHRFWISGESYAGMYLPELADLILKNQDKIIDGGKLDFKGMMIGNGAMNMDLYWRTKVPVTFFDKHYFFGPEIKALINTCKFDASDDSNPSCLMGLKLADEVNPSLLRLLPELTLTIRSVSATTCHSRTVSQREEGIDTLPSTKRGLSLRKTTSLIVIPTIQA